MAALRVVVLGAGYFAQFHVSGWLRNHDAQLVGLADPAPGRALALAEAVAGPDHGLLALTDPAALVAEADADIIDIVAPPAAHAALIDMALAARPRAIICQKPFCGALEPARAAVARIEAAAQLCVVHENFRFQPWYRRIKAEIHAGVLGDLYQITFRLRPGDGQGPDAYLQRQPYFQTMPRLLVHETAVHWIDTFRYLMGEPEAVTADLRRLNPAIAAEDAGLILLHYADGRRALFDGNRLADHSAENPRLTMGECLVEGSEASLTLTGDGRLHLRRRGALAARELPLDCRRDVFGGDCAHALQRHVTDHLLRGAPIENTAREYLRNMEIVEKVYAAAETGRRLAL